MVRARQGVWISALALAAACRPQTPAPVVPARPPTAAQAMAETFAPDIVGTVVPGSPRAGDYALQLGLAFDSFPTTELHLSTRRHGVVRLTLGSDGTASACAGVRTDEVVDGQWKYERDPAKRQHREDTQAQLVALRGTWHEEDGVAVIRFDHRGWTSCADDTQTTQEPTELRCVTLTNADRLPAGSLACTTNPRGELRALGLPMTRGGRQKVSQPAMSAPSGTELLLGAPGLAVDVEQDAQASLPAFTVRAATVALDEAAFHAAPRLPPKKP